MTKLPYDLAKTTSVAEAENARFLKITSVGDGVQIEVPQATLRSSVEVIPQPDDTAERLPAELRGDTVVWDVYQTVARVDNSEIISQYSTELALDRVTGAAAPWQEQWLNETGAQETPVGNVQYSGQIYKFPFGTEKKDYPVFDRDLKRAEPARYVGTESVGGLEAYKFEQRIADQPLNTPESSLKTLLGRFVPEATTGQVVYSNTRTLWVDPVTGAYLKVREQQSKVLVPDVGESTVLLDADFNYTEETVARSVRTAKDNGAKINLLRLYLPLILGVLGLAALVSGVVLVARPSGASTGRHAVPAGDPTPTRFDGSAVQDETPTAEQPTVEREGGPLTDEIPPASTNWRADEPTVPTQRPAPGEVEKR